MNLKRILPFGAEIETLKEFKDDWLSFVSTGQEEIDVRQRINVKMHTVIKFYRAIGIGTTFFYTPPPAIGGFACEVEMFSNIFSLHQWEISNQKVVDILDRGIGAYYEKRRVFLLNCINPLIWVKNLIMLPIILLEYLGFDKVRIEQNILVKIYQVFSAFITVAVTVLTLFQLLGINYLDWFGK